MNSTAIILSLAAALATFFGGAVALRLRDRLHLVLGFSAGAVMGVAFFDLIPEALELAKSAVPTRGIITIVAVGFALYLVIDRVVALHSHTHDDGHEHHRRGLLGASALALHSFLDGIGLGLAFQVSPSVGFIVALAVLAHDFSDGINTVTMIVKAAGTRSRAMRWLILDALAPLLGVLVTFLFSVSTAQLGILLALFAGFFLYIGASDLLPESHHEHPVYWTTFSTILGMAVLFFVVSFAA